MPNEDHAVQAIGRPEIGQDSPSTYEGFVGFPHKKPMGFNSLCHHCELRRDCDKFGQLLGLRF